MLCTGRKRTETWQDSFIGRVWISSRVTVLPKTKIYEGAVVAAGAVVTKNCEAYTIYGGIPAKKIGERSKKLFYEFTGRHEVFW